MKPPPPKLYEKEPRIGRIRRMTKLLTAIFLIFLALPAYAQQCHSYYEKDYQEAWSRANKGSMEVILPDLARVDCVTKTHAIEFDFAKKWGEAIGQSLYYATALHKKAGIVLIMEDGKKDQKYLDRVMAVAKNHDITVWTRAILFLFCFKIRNSTIPQFFNMPYISFEFFGGI